MDEPTMVTYRGVEMTEQQAGYLQLQEDSQTRAIGVQAVLSAQNADGASSIEALKLGKQLFSKVG